MLIVDPEERRLHWLALDAADDYQPRERSSLIVLGPKELSERIDWPE